MEMNIRREGDALIVVVEGELDLFTAGTFREKVENELSSHRKLRNLIISMNGVNFVDSSGLGVILGRYKRISQHGGKMAIVGVKPRVRKIFHLSGLEKIIPMYDSTEQALEAIQ